MIFVPVFESPVPGAVLRPAVEDDCGALAGLSRSAQAHPWSEGQYRDSVRAGHSCWLLAAPDSTAIACCVLMPLPDAVEVLDVVVSPQWRRRGIARALLSALLSALRRQQPERVESVLLEVRAGNTAARALYRGLGFREDGVRRNYYPAENGAREDAVLMSLPLR